MSGSHAPARAPTSCSNCDAKLGADACFCSHCGQKAGSPRLTLHEIGHELLHALVHVDRSALSLVRMLTVRPGIVSRDYVDGRRKRYFGPFAFVVTIVALTSAPIALSGFKTVSSDVPNAGVDFLQHHVNLLFFVQVPLLAAVSRLLNFRGSYNFAEYLVLASYTEGLHILYFAVVVVPVGLLVADHPLVQRPLYYANIPVWPLYYAFATSQFEPGNRLLAAGRGLVTALATQAGLLALISEFITLQVYLTRP